MTRGKKSKSHGGSKATPKPEPTRRTTTRRTPKVEQHEIALTRKRPSSKRTRHSVAKGGPPSKSPAQSVLAANILTVLNADLARLGPGEAVDLIRELLCAEARRIGLSTTEINVSAAVNMPDGGIDASVTTGG